MTRLTNEERSAREVAAFRADAPSPYFAYHRGPHDEYHNGRVAGMGREIVTWMGDELGRVLDLREPYRSGFGDWRQSFRAIGINGAVYAGVAYLSAGDYVRMRKVKPTPREKSYLAQGYTAV